MDSWTNTREDKSNNTVSTTISSPEKIQETKMHETKMNESGNAAGESTSTVSAVEEARGADTEKNREKQEPIRNKIEKKRRGWFSRFMISCLAFLLVFGIINLLYYVLGMEPFGTRAVSIDDAKIQYIDFFTYYVDVLHGVRPLSYDFGNMLGGSSIGLFSYYLASPFNLLLYYFGKKGVYKFFDLAVALKLGTAGATFSWFLQRRFRDRIRPVFVIALSMGYALMQYSVAQSSNIMWLDGVYMLPLILLGVYEVIHKKSVWRLVLTTVFCIFCNWYIAGICCLFSGIWFLFEFFFYDKEEDEIEGRKDSSKKTDSLLTADADTVKDTGAAKNTLSAKGMRASRSRGMYQRAHTPGILVGITDFVVSFCRYVWGMGLGVAMSAVLFLPVISAMRKGKGQYEEVKILMDLTGDLLSSVRGYVIGTQSDRGFAALFCGSIAVFAAASLIFSGSVKLRQKAAFIALAAVCLMMLHWEPAMLAFSLTKPAKSYWYRYSFLVCFAMLFGAGAYLSRAEKDKWTKLAVPVCSILYAAAVLKLNGIHFADFTARGMSLVSMHKPVFVTAAASVILALLTLVLLSDRKRGPARLAAGILLLAVTGAELWGNAWLFWKNHSDGSQELYMEYSEGLGKQLSRLKSLDRGYYRIAQDRTRHHYEDDLTAYFNDSLAQNYWSNTAYTSSPDNAQLSLMWRLGYRDEEGCMMIVRDPVLASDSFLGVKYLLQSTPVRGLKRVKNVDSFNGRSVYLNPYALPMAFVYDGSKLPTRRYDNTFDYQNTLFSILSGRKTELYKPLEWTRENRDNKAFFRVFIPEGDYVAYGNLLWPEKMDGLLSINGDVPFGYCRWTSPAVFMIKSRSEQEQSEKDKSLQAIAQAEKERLAQQEAAGQASNGLEAAGQGINGQEAAGQEPGEASQTGVNSKTESGPAALLNRLAEKILVSAEPEADTDFTGQDDQSLSEEGLNLTGQEQSPEEEELSLTQQQMLDLQTAAEAYDWDEEDAIDGSGYADIRTVVFRTEKGLTFKDYQFYGLDLKELKEASQRIQSGEVSDIKIENGHVTCSLEGRRGNSLCLLVPWTDGWVAWRNGEQVQPDTVAGTMITIPLENGENRIELKYHIPYLQEGMYISAAAFAVLLIDCLRRALRRRKNAR